ncbi:TetR family transcriptional regulator [Ferribacterium limneticum]|uniref:TetR family transcriptional regulator n=1 Tax=Ferribacterium limneticum TaxID=76259 RepID=UPI001CF91484|nr:TetR family transcriptional regulator [Ferribacterium limneticum]UCV23665.1 TetR family transcriptional regulator [Ferribacterium limneticum]
MVKKTKKESEKTRLDIINAARMVFLQRGVARSTLEIIAKEAGVTRGAVYWHFRNKADLFLAMCENVFEPLIKCADAPLQSNQFENPLDAIQDSIKEFFRVFEECSIVREVFVIMASRCEYVDEFASVQKELSRPFKALLQNIEKGYQHAATNGKLRSGLDPTAMAHDTYAFTNGLLRMQVNHQNDSDLSVAIARHMALRRA